MSIGLVYALFLLIFLGLAIFVQKRERQMQLKIKGLEEYIEQGEEEYSKIEESFSETASKNTSGYIFAEIKKREKLEAEIVKLKSTLFDTKSIAQDASMVKSEFLTNMRHEVRTPLNSILVFADLLQKNLKDKELNSFATSINNSGHKLLSLLDNIIELSAIESGSFEIKESAIETQGYFNSIMESFKSAIDKKGLEYSLEMDKKLPDSLMIDTIRVKEIVDNLIDNAIKFTNSGYVKVRIIVNSKNSANNTVDISILVEDSGSGIDKQNQDKIFEIFEKKDNCNSIEFEGTGLGLSINRKLASLMNGTLKVQSVLKKGSLFTLNLKEIEIVLDTSYNKLEHSSINFSLIGPDGGTILVVDSESDVRELFEKSFSSSKIEVKDFDNSRSAISFLQTQSVDLIFIDIEMLSVDDGAVSQVLSRLSSAPVVTLTRSRLKGVNFGIGGIKPVGHLLKPISEPALFKIALKIFNAQTIILEDEIINTKDENHSLDKESLKMFLIKHEESLNSLYLNALKTNDLNAIRKFADATLEASLECELNEISTFCELLIDKIDLFEIDSISDMLALYESKIKRYNSLFKE